MTNSISKIRLAALILISIPCIAGGLGAPDANCNPSVDTPVAGGCTWYNFYAFIADGSIHAGSSFANYYVPASDPAWTFTTTTPQVLRIVDGGHQGDIFDVYDNGILLGSMSATPINADHSCAGDPTGQGTDPAACWNDPLMSRGTFPIAPGSHSITVVWQQRVPGGDSDLQWFEIGAPSGTTNLTFVGSMPHIATEEDWTTTFLLVNKGGAPAEARLSAYGDSGLPLMLPLALPQPPADSLIASSIDRTLAPNASLIVGSSGPSNVPVLVGAAQLAAAGPVDGFAIFHKISDAQEAVVPMETRNASSYLLAFDNTNNIALGVALQNVSAQAANVQVVVRDDTGAVLGTGSVFVPGSAHTSFVLATQFPWTANLRGTAEFITPQGGQISLLGVRYTPPGTLTTIPVLANVGANGGSIAHIASSNGWKTTFVLVNAGNSFGQAHLKFFADDGRPLPLSVSFPQTGGGTSVTSTVDRSLAAGATLIVESTGPLSDPVQVGSAQLTADGNVSGFVIFRYEPNGQEAVAPLEDRTANALVLAFDNTAGTVTGVAVNSVSGQPVNIPVVIRDDTGTQVGTGSLSLAANGHSSFLLAARFPASANIRGTIEFGTPAGARIGVLGVRTPIRLTFTTLPALAK